MSRAFVVGITGGSGAGKTTLADALADALGVSHVARLPLDAYYRDLSPLPPDERAMTNFDSPASIDFALYVRDLQDLRQGRAVRPPAYDFSTHTRIGPAPPVAPAPVILSEGVLLAAEPAVRDRIDLLVFVDAPAALRLARRAARDVAGRGRTEESVRAQWESTVLPMHRAHVAPARATADLVVSGEDDPAGDARILAARIRSHTDLTEPPTLHS